MDRKLKFGPDTNPNSNEIRTKPRAVLQRDTGLVDDIDIETGADQLADGRSPRRCAGDFHHEVRAADFGPKHFCFGNRRLSS